MELGTTKVHPPLLLLALPLPALLPLPLPAPLLLALLPLLLSPCLPFTQES